MLILKGCTFLLLVFCSSTSAVECPPDNPSDHDILLPGPDCSHYYECDWGTAILRPCPKGLQWNQNLLSCVLPSDSQCSDNPSTGPEPNSTPVPSTTQWPPASSACPSINPPDHDVLLPGPDCNHFYKCNWGVPVLQACPATLEWSQELQHCDYPSIAKCSDGHSSVEPPQPEPSPTSAPEPLPTISPQPNPSSCPAINPPDHDVLLPGPDCNHFYKCNWGVPVLQDCPATLEWSQELQRCDYPSIAHCSI